MAIDERRRHQLFGRLQAVIGEDHAVTLMEYLPPMGWSDVARKSDLDALEARLTSQFRSELTAALIAQTRTLVFLVLGALTSAGALALVSAPSTRKTSVRVCAMSAAVSSERNWEVSRASSASRSDLRATSDQPMGGRYSMRVTAWSSPITACSRPNSWCRRRSSIAIVCSHRLGSD